MKNVMFQIKYDFINGIVHQWKKFLLIAVVYAVLITDFLVRCKTKHFMGQYTSSDIILYIFRGMRWIVDVQTDINIPTAYILPNILIGFAIGNYPFKDINGYGGMVLMRAGKKLVWWISKCIWAVLTACICYGILILEIAGVSLAGGRLSLQVNRQVCISIDGYDKKTIKKYPKSYKTCSVYDYCGASHNNCNMPCTDMRFTDYGTDYRVHCCRSYTDYGSIF